MKFLGVAVLALVAACGEDQVPKLGDDVLFPDLCQPVACATGPAATNAAGVEAVIEASPSWPGLGEYTTGCLRASDEIPITGSFVVRGDDLEVSACGGEGAGCRPEVRFRIDGDVAGVECLEPEGFFDFTLCGEIRLTDTTVRVRTVLQDTHPGQYNYMPVVDVLPACNTECAFDERMCEATNTCWGKDRDYCAYCLNGSNEECACWTSERVEPDGSACSYFISGDSLLSGTCQSGVCVD